VESAEKALWASGKGPSSITHIVTVSCTGFMAPGVDQHIIRELKLPNTVERVHVGFMGCHGALNGLKVAQGLAQLRRDAVVLLSAVELCSLHYYMGEEPGKIVANALFADGSASLVASSHQPGPWTVTQTGSCILPDSAQEMGWLIDDYGFEMTLSKKVPAVIGVHLRRWLTAWLAERKLNLELIRSWAIHPGGPKIVAAVKEALHLSDADLAPSLGVLNDYGNMSSPTVLFILDRLRQADAPRPCVMIGFGPGLVAEAALIE
jgi:prepilin-type processing-associated H-X9-DG protein